ncbi:hypothetical protein TVAG_343320 [Trichomonas vaginalis G3]|uniref:Uncharacterized protein n=1 Tax=Trichomonas vaginalis (strain ATCC PRA-98 / G3) TaxID=412133 RepID=A2E1D6_TRIV3|nr:hypothetical protein TVAGG3_0320190 [Trichomonas vaginalis G3]EAY13503.1 hypothetical protein TVAG_343320 [Trichomonas vaginalis G3]KAI5529233.1 hypothetical protein TVAGG3_0320190 [Trichomonas vaginalis G3]|eukprot:XP_001325726.1 hypothetical protein [Trichomonas vaginalis G3]
MILNSDNDLLSRISSLSHQIQPSLQIAYERGELADDFFRSRSFIQNNTSIRAKDNNGGLDLVNIPRGLTQIPSKTSPFFLLLKPETKKKSPMQYLLYSSSQSILVSEDVKQLEILPENTEFYLDQKRFYIYVDENPRKYVFNVRREILDIVLTNTFANPLEPFLLCYIANGKMPPNTNLTAGYYSKVIFNNTFLFYYYLIPQNFIYPDIVSAWTTAANSNFDLIFSQILRHYFSEHRKSELELNEKSFFFKVIESFLTHDTDFLDFTKEFDRPEGDSVEFYISKCNLLTMSSYSHYATFLMYHEFETKYGAEFATQVICKVIYYSGLRPKLAKKFNFDIKPIDKLLEFTDDIDPKNKIRLFNTVKGIISQPINYIPRRTNATVYASYSLLLENIISNGIDFLKIIRKLEKHQPWIT